MQKFKDQLHLKKRKKILKRGLFFLLIVLVVVGAGIYVLFFARLLDVREVRIEVRGDHGEELGQAINDWLDDDFLKIKKRNNTLILSSDTLATDLMALFPRMDFLNGMQLFYYYQLFQLKKFQNMERI